MRFYDDERDGHGDLIVDNDRAPIKLLSFSRPRYAHSDHFELEFRLSEESPLKLTDLDLSGEVRFQGKTHRGRAIHIAPVRWTRAEEQLLIGSCDQIDFNLDQPEFEIERQAMSAFLTPTTLSAPIGDENPLELDPAKLTWSTPFGQAVLRAFPEQERTNHDQEEGRAKIWRAHVGVDVAERHHSRDFTAILGAFQENLRCPARLLSLLDRRHVDVASLGVTAWGNHEGRAVFHEGHRIRRTRTTGTTQYGSLVNLHDPPKGAFEEWLQGLIASDVSEALLRTIGFLVEGFRSELIEHQLLHAFTALETFVQSLDESQKRSNTLSASQFGKLASHVRAAIREYAEGRGWQGSTTHSLLDKVPELRRSPIVPRVVARVEEFGVDWRDLWPEGVDLRDALGRAYRRRSLFIHTGHIEDLRIAFLDCTRIQALAERLVFAAIGGHPKWIWWGAVQHLRVLEVVKEY